MGTNKRSGTALAAFFRAGRRRFWWFPFGDAASLGRKKEDDIMNSMNLDEQMALLTKGAEEVLTPEDLCRKLAEGRPLDGPSWAWDSSAPDLHLGHAVVQRKIRQFPIPGASGGHHHRGLHRHDRRPHRQRAAPARPLSREQVLQNARTYRADPPCARPGAHRGGLQQRLAGQDELPPGHRAGRHHHRRPHPGAGGLQNRMQNHAPLGMHELFYP